MDSKIKKSFNSTSLFLTLTTVACLQYSGNVLADVISNNISPDIQEPASTYAQGVNILNMTVDTVIGTGSCTVGSYDGCTLNDILNDIDGSDDFEPEIKVHMTADDFPHDGLASNATMRLRGLMSRNNAQKSFRIKLDSKKDLWRDQRRIQLVKAMLDFTRVRNKLSYDLFSEIPHLPSMRSQFVHLTVNDQGESEDYGIFTHIEHFGKEYLKRRDWDKDSRVYKAENFMFYEDSALALDATTGKPVDEKAFEKILEIKRGKKHFAFSNMLKDLNDPSKDFNTQIMGKYFNKDNYLTWLAVNILVNNYDTTLHNYYLYNPKDNEHFYLVPWDYDLAFSQTLQDPRFGKLDQLPRWWFTHANWWTVYLHQRFLSEPGNLELLKQAVAEIKDKHLSVAKIKAKADSYYDLVFPIINADPDWSNLYIPGATDPERVAEYNRLFADLSNKVEGNYSRFMAGLDDPMPFEMKKPSFLAENNIKFSWFESKSLSAQTIIYDLEVATTKDFKAGTIIRSEKNLTATSHTLKWTHPKGTYYFRVRSKDALDSKNWQEATNYGLTYDNGFELYGVSKIVVKKNGTPPPSGGISNPVSSIQIDGNASDWMDLTPFGQDSDDIPAGSKNVIDLKQAKMAHTNQNLYFFYENHGAVNPAKSSGSYLPWGWVLYIDADTDSASGFKYSNTLGVEYLLSGHKLYKYTGTGADWSWSRVHTSESKYKNTIEEFGFARGLIGNPQSINFVFEGVNEAFGGNTVDYYPDGAATQGKPSYYSYSFGSVDSVNHPPVTNDKNLSVEENKASNIGLTASDPDGDDLTIEIKSQPAHGTLNLTSSALFVEYTPNSNYVGNDSFSYVVNDGKVDSNTSTVSIIVTKKPATGGVISNHVVRGAITINGSKSDWDNLDFFPIDPDDAGSDSKNVINWERASIAHSSDSVYILFQNYENIDPNKAAGSKLNWAWQVFLDTDNSSSTGFYMTKGVYADYMLEGHNIYKYAGSGGDWNWVYIGTANVKFKNKIAELEFPRSLLSSHSTVKVMFYGNNTGFGGTGRDKYPDSNGFKYSFGAGRFGKNIPVGSHQRGVVKSPLSHKPVIKSVTTPNTSSKGGSFSWLFLFSALLILRRQAYKFGRTKA